MYMREDVCAATAEAATRDGFGAALVELGGRDSRVVVLCADLSESTRTLAFKEKFPERFIEVGVAEQNLAALASGIAAAGKIPFIASYAVFSPGRNWEQLRTSAALNTMPVKIAGMHAGVSVGPDGATHQALEDVSLMRVLPGMTVLSPCDSEEARKATIAAASLAGPVYLRLTREKTPVMTTPQTPFEIGKANLLWSADAPQVVLCATGPLVHQALCAARALDAGGVGTVVLNVHTIKPLDEEGILAQVRACGAVVSVEEHQIAGGLGGAIAELLARRAPAPMEFVGVQDRFGQSGTPEELLEHYGLTAPHIIEAAKRAVARKGMR